jgi:hypothetical protein
MKILIVHFSPFSCNLHPRIYIWSHDRVSTGGVSIVIRFTEHLQLVFTSKDYALTVVHTSQITIGHTMFY